MKFTIPKSQRTMKMRVWLYTVGMFFMAVGVNFAVVGNLGLSPVNAIPYVLSVKIGLTQGTCVNFFFIILIIAQICILRRDFAPWSLLQFVATAIFGLFVDLTAPTIWLLATDVYVGRLGLLCISMITLAFGVTIYLRANLVPMPMESLILAIITKVPKTFAQVKIVMDTSCIVCCAILSFILFGTLIGVREGSLISAVVVGRIVPYMERLIDKMVGPEVDAPC